MKTSIKITLVFCCFLLSVYIVNAKGFKYGKFSKEEILLTECAYEPDAEAVILSRTCTVNISYSSITYNYLVRIKILKEEGLDRANIEIPYWRKDGLENITGVKAHTVNIDAKGGKTDDALEKKSVFKVDINENYGAVRFGMPNVKVGSIIEYRYSLISNFYTYLDTWYFQDDIPTLWSSIKVNMPESFRYDLVMFGNRLKSKYPMSKSNEWILTNLKSIREEPYVNNYMDFVEQMRFQLTGYYKSRSDMSGGVEFVTARSTWEKLAEEYLDAFEFFGRKNFAQKTVAQILDGDENSWEKVEKIYDYVRTNIKWDGKYRIYPENSPPKIIEEKIASNCEINFLLVLLLREAGIKAEPALSRTNNLGLLQKDYPLMSQFNQALAYVEIFNNKLFLNATSPFRPYQILAEKDLNFYAFVLEKNKTRWEKVKAFNKSRSQLILNYDFTNKERPACQFKMNENGYYAAETRELINEFGLEEFLKTVVDESEMELHKDSLTIENLDNVNKPLLVKANFPMAEIDLENDIIYFEPFPAVLDNNPFKKEDRQYRVDFNYNRYQSIVVNIKLPQEYMVEDCPKSRLVKLSNNLGYFRITAQKQTNGVQLRTVFEIKQPSFTIDYYGELRELYSQMLSSIKGQVVIKKNNTISEK
ncbi:DUF3857 domain-containing protein [Marinifilum caeruleilacunae]|uniref:DUF3857 domain-containing protein n=1 Tax=Marinifilum caeruleilacunae TaxID=2499076 RepID=A0ABX1WRM6_9BACT|nr:DUF3857 domain-containing protein [Marinifilum caeruleilacunae]NOU58728.1 DUF3857 domain-containing protein [Marinifilum caeruleilacunae]